MVLLSPASPAAPQQPHSSPRPTWPSACAPSAHARPPRSSTRCGCCPACGPPLRSQLGTDPWSCWYCFLRRSRRERGWSLQSAALIPTPGRLGPAPQHVQRKLCPPPRNTPLSHPSWPRCLGEAHRKAARRAPESRSPARAPPQGGRFGPPRARAEEQTQWSQSKGHTVA